MVAVWSAWTASSATSSTRSDSIAFPCTTDTTITAKSTFAYTF